MAVKQGSGRVTRAACGLAVVAALGLGVWVTPGVAGFKSGIYSGTSSQPDQHLQLKVNRAKTKITVVFFELDAPPCGGLGGLQYAGLKAHLRSNGKFKALSPGDGFYGYVKGRVHGAQGDGTARYHADASGCETGVLTWEALND